MSSFFTSICFAWDCNSTILLSRFLFWYTIELHSSCLTLILLHCSSTVALRLLHSFSNSFLSWSWALIVVCSSLQRLFISPFRSASDCNSVSFCCISFLYVSSLEFRLPISVVWISYRCLSTPTFAISFKSWSCNSSSWWARWLSSLEALSCFSYNCLLILFIAPAASSCSFFSFFFHSFWEISSSVSNLFRSDTICSCHSSLSVDIWVWIEVRRSSLTFRVSMMTSLLFWYSRISFWIICCFSAQASSWSCLSSNSFRKLVNSTWASVIFLLIASRIWFASEFIAL